MTGRLRDRDAPARHLRTTSDFLHKSVVEALCLRAQDLKHQRSERRMAPTLSGRVVGLLFEKHSTRTRLSFEAGVALLGCAPLVISSKDTQIDRGEPIADTARVMGRYLDALVGRVYAQSTIDEFAKHAGIPVINGLSDFDHPCQALTDYFTVYERREDPSALTWAYVGDGNNMANAYIQLAGLCGFRLRVASPKAFAPDAEVVRAAVALGADIQVTTSVTDALSGADVVLTDVWTSMGQESENAERLKAFEGYQLNAETLAQAHPDHLVLHCLPAHRGEEISEDVLEGTHSVVFDQAGNRLPAQQAILEWLMEVPGTVRLDSRFV